MSHGDEGNSTRKTDTRHFLTIGAIPPIGNHSSILDAKGAAMKHLVPAALVWAALAFPAAAETIRVGMSGGYFPFTFVQQDKLQGFEVDFMNAVAAETGDTVEFSTMAFSGLIGALEAGRIDTVANQITITPGARGEVRLQPALRLRRRPGRGARGQRGRSTASRTCAARPSRSTSARTSSSCCASCPSPTRSTSRPTRATSSRTPRSAGWTPSSWTGSPRRR